jgi:hypothetical protein
MNIFKRLGYFLADKYHLCSLCNHTGELKISGLKANMVYEYHYASNNDGILTITCPACEGRKIIWGLLERN